MGILTGKKGIVFGVANEKSIAWACATEAQKHGAEVGITYFMPEDKYEKYLKPHVEKKGFNFAFNCDVTDKDNLDTLFEKAENHFGSLDFIVHSIAFAKKEELDGEFKDTSRDGYELALDVSSYTFIELARRSAKLMKNGGSITTMTYIGSEKVMRNYNVMGVAKAALEANVRYLAFNLGKKNIRVNALSCGALDTRAASGIAEFDKTLKTYKKASPLGKAISTADVGKANLFLISDLASGVTGEILHVDNGVHIVGLDNV